ncbi:hypothetical protein [Marinisporobacter balticus]|uniref:TM2 domain-containing protein n=1 Tax=Marinisporobacter balticus TaxID=2018667 RepID=A0A4R2KK95_9FIRM|nr:hypothetical protein [Marinisporobacter balticus]TCO71046.1 hypothetical protein EV214_12334 [Marinisporobacter balticus]
MNKKSRFTMILLSCIPGLSHLYLGLRDRAIIFLLSFFGAIVGTGGICFIVSDDDPMIILVFALPIIWLIALIDAFSLREKLYQNHSQSIEGVIPQKQVSMEKSNRKTIAMILSIIPGAGHMYIGLQKKGLTSMSIFFFTVFFMGWLGISLFLFILPVIWFYSFFDVFHLVDEESPCDEEFIFPLPKIKHKWIGWGLIVLGDFVILERIVYPLIPWEIQRYVQTSIVAIILIGSGVKLLIGSKKDNAKEDTIWKEEE